MAEPHKFRLLVVGLGKNTTTFLDRLVRGLSEKQVELTLATSSRPKLSIERPESVKWLWAPNWEDSFASRMARLVGLLARQGWGERLSWVFKHVNGAHPGMERLVMLYRLLPFTHGRWDAIYFPWNSAAIAYQPLYELGIPVVVSCRGSQVNIRPHTPGQEGYTRQLTESLRGAAAVHCVSADIQREAVALGAQAVKTVVIRPAVDPDFFTPSLERTANKQFTIVTTGGLVWLKGYEVALLALRQLVESGVDAAYHIIGDGPERQRLLFTIQDLGLEGRVVLHGRLTPPQVRDALQRADVFLLASHSEGIANAALEAMSCALPVVTTDCGGMREAVTDGLQGFVVPVRDPQAMTLALDKLSRLPELRARMGQAGRQRVIMNFTLDAQLNAWVQLLRSLKR